MKNFALFLMGTYRENDLPFYKRLCRGKTTVAVDGGLRFFVKANLKPDILIGDFDSARKIPKKLCEKTQVLAFPKAKDKTDSHLALDHCLEDGAASVDIVMPTIGEPDHFLANLMMLTSYPWGEEDDTVKVRVVNPKYEAFFLEDSLLAVADAVGDTVSVLPLTDSIQLSCTGCEYRADSLTVERGDSRSLRNKINAKRARIAVTGQALLIHHFK